MSARPIREGDVVRYQGHTWEVMSRVIFKGETVASLALVRHVEGATIRVGVWETDVTLVGEQHDLPGMGR